MMPLAKLWSWTGHAFILFAIGWAIFVRGGLSDKSLSEGVAISQGYWGLVVALIAANALVWTSALYVRAAKRAKVQVLVPPNTNFEELADRKSHRFVGDGCNLHARCRARGCHFFGPLFR